MTRKRSVRFDVQPLGIDSESEGALCEMLGIKRSWPVVAFDAWDFVQESINANGYSPRVHYSGYLMPYMAECVRIGIEIGRKLERNPIVDALYCGTPAAPSESE